MGNPEVPQREELVTQARAHRKPTTDTGSSMPLRGARYKSTWDSHQHRRLEQSLTPGEAAGPWAGRGWKALEEDPPQGASTGTQPLCLLIGKLFPNFKMRAADKTAPSGQQPVAPEASVPGGERPRQCSPHWKGARSTSQGVPHIPTGSGWVSWTNQDGPAGAAGAASWSLCGGKPLGAGGVQAPT